MFPWFPFFVYPQKSPHNQRRRQPNLMEEMMEVRAIADDTKRTGPPFRIVYHVPPQSEQCSSTSLLPKAPTENIKIEFHAENPEKENGVPELEEGAELFTKPDYCPTIASTSSQSSGSKRGSRSDGNEAKSSMSSVNKQPSPKLSTESISSGKSPTVVQRSNWRRSAFETSQAMRDIFGGTNSENQKEEKKTETNLEVETVNTETSFGQDKFSEPEQTTSGTEHKTIPNGVKSQGVSASAMESAIEVASTEKSHTTTTISRQRNVARVAPFAYFPSKEEEAEEPERPLAAENRGRSDQIIGGGEEELVEEPVQKTEKEAVEKPKGSERNKEAPINNNDHKKEEKAKETDNNQLSQQNGLIEEHHHHQNPIVNQLDWRDKPTGEEEGGKRVPTEPSLPGYQNRGQQLVTEDSKRRNANQQSESERRGAAKFAEGRNDNDDTSSGRRRTAGGGGGGGGEGAFDPFEMVTQNQQTSNGTAGGDDSIGKQLLIRNALVVNDDGMFKANILIEGGVIKKISDIDAVFDTNSNQIEVVDAAGKCLLPAGIDVHTTLLKNGQTNDIEQLVNGTKAALFGGTGMIIDVFTPTNDGLNDRIDDLLTRLDNVQKKINELAECNVALSICVNKWRGERSRDCMTQMVRKGGVNNFVLELSTDTELFEALDHARNLGALSRVFPEDKNLTSLIRHRLNLVGANVTENFEAGRVRQLCTLSELTNAPISIVSLSSSAAGRALLENGCSSGALLSAELPVAAVAQMDRSRERDEAVDSLLNLLANYPNSVCVSGQSAQQMTANFVGQRMSILWEKAVLSGKMDPMRFVAVTSANAARCFNIYPKKGRVAVGSDADLVLWDFQRMSSSSHSSSSFRPSSVILAGKLRFHLGKFETASTEKKKKMFMRLSPNSPFLFSVVRLREKKFDFSDFLQPVQAEDRKSSEEKGPSGSSHAAYSVPEEQQHISLARPSSCNRNAQSDQLQSRAATKVIHPPGGKSSALW